MEYPSGFKAEIHSKKPICGVLAVAVCAGVSYDVAHAITKKVTLELMPERQRFGGRTYLKHLRVAMERLAVKLSPTIVVNKPLTVARFAREYAKPGMTYLLQISGHFLCVRDGIAIDQEQSLPVELHKCQRCQVKKFIAVEGKGW